MLAAIPNHSRKKVGKGAAYLVRNGTVRGNEIICKNGAIYVVENILHNLASCDGNEMYYLRSSSGEKVWFARVISILM